MIKLFDQYNPYYTKINYHQLIEFMDYDANINNFNNKIISFTQDELNKLQSLIPNLIFKLYKRTTSTDPLIRFQHEESKNTLDGYIHKFKDEWYVVSNTTTYYKCDQLEGVMKCIQDIYL